MSGPWDRYKSSDVAVGPWTQYATGGAEALDALYKKPAPVSADQARARQAQDDEETGKSRPRAPGVIGSRNFAVTAEKPLAREDLGVPRMGGLGGLPRSVSEQQIDLPAVAAARANAAARRAAPRPQDLGPVEADNYLEMQYEKGKQTFAGMGAGIVRAVAPALRSEAGQTAVGSIPFLGPLLRPAIDPAATALEDRSAKIEAQGQRGVEGETTFEDVKASTGIGDTLVNTAKFIADQGPSSLAQMPLLLSPLGQATYATSLTGQIAQERATADGRDSSELGDVAIAAPFAAASVAMDRYGLDKIVGTAGRNAATRIAKAGGTEMLTEGGQSVIEYAGGSLGTRDGFDPATALDQAAQGAILGGAMGGGVRAGVEAVDAGVSFSERRATERRAREVNAPGVREASIADAVANITPEDEASPHDTADIAYGRAVIADTEAGRAADAGLASAGMPKVGTRVVIDDNGTLQTGTMSDWFDAADGAGVVVDLDNGKPWRAYNDDIAELGIAIRPFDRTAEADAIDARLAELATQPEAGIVPPLPAMEPPGEQASSPPRAGSPATGGGAVILPVNGRITSGFGARHAPKAGASTNHSGTDFAVPIGTPVKAPADGVVTFADMAGNNGNLIRVDHGNGVVTAYAHLDGIDVKVGDRVAGGAVIGRSGNTGNSTGPHLHYAVKVGGKPVDPTTFRFGASRGGGEAASAPAEQAPQVADSDMPDRGAAPDFGTSETAAAPAEPDTRGAQAAALLEPIAGQAAATPVSTDPAPATGMQVGNVEREDAARIEALPTEPAADVAKEAPTAADKLGRTRDADGILRPQNSDTRVAAQDAAAALYERSEPQHGGFTRYVSEATSGGGIENLPDALRDDPMFMQGWRKGREWLEGEVRQRTSATSNSTTAPTELPTRPVSDLLVGDVIRKGGEDFTVVSFQGERPVLDDGSMLAPKGPPAKIVSRATSSATPAVNPSISDESREPTRPDAVNPVLGNEAAAAPAPPPAAPAAVSSPSSARIEQTTTGKSIAVVGASASEVAAIEAAIPNAKAVTRKDGALVYSKKYEAKIGAALASTREADLPDSARSAIDDARAQLPKGYSIRAMGDGSIEQTDPSGRVSRNLQVGTGSSLQGTLRNIVSQANFTAEREAAGRSAIQRIAAELPDGIRMDDDGRAVRFMDRSGKVVASAGLSSWGDPMIEAAQREKLGLAAPTSEGTAQLVIQPLRGGPATTMDLPPANDTLSPRERAQLNSLKRRNTNGESLDDGDMSLMLDLSAKERGTGPARSPAGETDSKGRLEIVDTRAPVESAESTAPDRGGLSETERNALQRLSDLGNSEAGKVIQRGYAKGKSEVSLVSSAVAAMPAGTPPAPTYGTANKVFTSDAAEKARALLRSKRNQLNSGFDPEIAQAGLTLMGYHIEAGARAFIDASRAVAADLGMTPTELRNSLRSWYSSARIWMEDNDGDVRGMDDDATVKVDLSRIQQWGATSAADPAKKGDDASISNSVPASDAGSGSSDVQRTSQNGSDGSAPRPQDRGSNADVSRPDNRSGDVDERGDEGSRLGTRSDGTGLRDADNLPAAERDAGSGSGTTREAADAVKGKDWSIEPGSLDEGRSFAQKARDNVEAIALVKQIEREGRPATRAEQATIARYVGWGGIKNIFPDSQGEYGKGFETLGPRLRDLLTDEEYNTAKRSIQYAHYTGETVVRGMWTLAGQLGFRGGSVFEPGMGTGNFRGMMPASIASASNYNGLEYDHLTASIARLLYPQSGVRQADFTAVPLVKDAIDLVIGNPPFSETVVSGDAEYGKHRFLLHDFFFAKSLDAVKPGGLLMFVTSAGTMNKRDTKARQYLADRADLVGAIRLPGNAFEKNAGTSVTTDIVVLRKRLPGEKPGDMSWVGTAPVTLPDRNGNPHDGAVSQYFMDHPEMVLGEQGFFDQLVASVRYAVRAPAGFSLDTALAEAIGRFGANLVETAPAADAKRTAPALDLASGEKKDGSYYIADGKLMQYRAGAGTPVQTIGKGVIGGMSKAAQERVMGLVPIKEALRDVYSADLAEDAAKGDAARKVLNKAYDAFVKKFGPINKTEVSYRRPSRVEMEGLRAAAREEARLAGSEWDDGSFDISPMLDAKDSMANIAAAREAARDNAIAAGRQWNEGSFDPADVPDKVTEKRPNLDPFLDDEEGYRLSAIEHFNRETGEAAKGRAFTENAIKLEAKPTISSANDALLYSLNRMGRPDIGVIADMAGLSRGEVIETLGDSLFEIPGKPDVFETSETYLSGNVREKLASAREYAARNPAFERNAKALEAAIPVPLTSSEIAASLGMPWIPTATVEQFAVQHMGLSFAKVTYIPKLAQWLVKGDRNSAAATSQWGTERMDAVPILLAALNRQTPTIRDKHQDGTSTINAVATQAVQDKMAEMKAAFRDWIWSDEQRTNALVSTYNENYNALVAPSYDGAYLTTPGIASDWSWRPHQRAVVARIIQAGNTYMAHEVGAGKTSAMIGAGMEMKRLGLVKKPMYVVPNHMLAQFTKEFYEQYPLARIKVADEDRGFHTSRRKRFIAQMATEDLDAVIIKHSAFGYIPMSDDFQASMIDAQIADLELLLSEIGKDQEQRITRRKIEAQKEGLEQRLRGLNNRKRDQVFTFEETGIDFLFVDEAHLFRKLDFSTKMGNVKGIDPNGSQMSFDLFAKTRYLEEQRPGRNLVLASGTPITNTMAELYSVSRYLQSAELEKRGLGHFDAWAGAFGDTVTALEQDPAGGYKSTTRFAQFVNVPELSVMVRQVMDVVGAAKLREYVTLPTLKGGERQMIVAEMTPSQESYKATLQQRMEIIRARKGPPAKGDDIILSVIGDGRKAAIDYRLIDASAPKEPGSKLEMMIDNVAQRHKEFSRVAFHTPGPAGTGYIEKPAFHGPATQMIFSDFGINGDFPVHKYIKQSLVARGIPAGQVAIISDYKTNIAKQRLFNDVNEGKVRVLIGSVAKMGTGVNAQRRLRAIHNMDAQWFPANDTQRNGRGIRQGNMNPEIEILDYATHGTYDSTMWAMMGRKGKFIEGFMRGDPTMRDMEDLGEASLYEQAAALTTSDPRVMTLTEWKQDLEKLQRRKVAHDRDQQSIRARISEAESTKQRAETLVPLIEQDIGKRDLPEGDDFKADAGGKTYDDRGDFGEALYKAADDLRDRAAGKELREGVGTLGGFSIIAETHPSFDGPVVNFLIKRAGNRESSLKMGTDSRGLVTRLTNTIRQFDSELANAKAAIERAGREAADFAGSVGSAFDDGGKAAALREKIAELEATFDAETKAAEDAKAAPATPPADAKQLVPDGGTTSRAADAAELQARLESYGIARKVALRVVDTLNGAAGTYRDALIQVATDTGQDGRFTLDHEVIHALRDLGVFNTSEWAVLAAKAKRDPVLMRSIRQRYPRLDAEAQTEEAVADMFARYQRGDYKPDGTAARVFKALRQALEAMRSWLAGNRARTAEGVMGAIARGEAGSRMTSRGSSRGPRKDMVVYHGSPHDWDKPSTDHIGTGEGAQVYGWGLYFASKKGIAEHYKRALTRSQPNVVRWKGELWNEVKDRFNTVTGKWADENWDALMALDRVEVEGSVAGAIEAQEKLLNKFPTDVNRSTLAWLKAHGDEITVEQKGRLYTLDIPEDGEYLLWDKPLSEQPKPVRDAIEALGDMAPQDAAEWDNVSGNGLYRRLANRAAKDARDRVRNGQLIDDTSAGADQAASLALKDAGIAGIKYLDGGSRSAGDGSFNYVLFDADRATVLEKYSMPQRDDMVALGGSEPTWKGRMGDAFDKWRTRMQDRYLPMLKVQRQIEAQTGRALPPSLNPYMGEELMAGRIGSRLETLADDHVQPLFDAMYEEKVDLEELETFLYARHAPERNARMQEINPELADGEGSGMTDIEARAVMARVRRSGKFEAMERLASRLDAIREMTLDFQVESGLISADQAAEMRATYEHYVPLRGFKEVDGAPEPTRQNRSGGGINVRGRESKAAYGRRSKADSPVSYLIMQAEEAIVRGETNRVAQRFVKLAQANPDPNFWDINKVTPKRQINPDTGLVESYLTTNMVGEDSDWTVTAKFNGKERRVTMNRANPDAKRLADAMRNLTQHQMDWVTLHLGKLNRFLSAVNTSYNPEFVITNAFRDIQTAAINLSGEEIQGIVAGTLKDYKSALVASTKGAFGKQSGEWGQWYEEFTSNGGRVYFNKIESIDGIQKRIASIGEMTAAKNGEGGARLQAKRLLLATADFVEAANNGVENAVRLSVYKNARERGLSPERAASLAKNITVNFNRRGTAGPALNAAYMFYNAGVQGTARFMMALKSKRVRRVMAVTMIAGAAAELLNMMMSEDDEDGESFYDKIPAHIKGRNLIFMLPNGKSYIKIPAPYGYNIFWNAGRSAAEVARRGGDRWKETGANFVTDVMNAFNPIGGAESLINMVLPTTLDPIADLTFNRDFTDKPIMPDQPAYDSPTPDHQRYWGSVKPYWKAITDTLSDVTGGDAVQGGAIDVSPETLEYIAGYALGAAGKLVMNDIPGLIAKGLDPDEDVTINEHLFVRKVLGDKAPWYDKSAYYDRVAQVDQQIDYAKGYLDAEDMEATRAFVDKNEDILGLEDVVKASKKDMREVRKARRANETAHDKKQLTAEEYRAEKLVIERAEKLVIGDFNTRWNEAMGVE